MGHSENFFNLRDSKRVKYQIHIFIIFMINKCKYPISYIFVRLLNEIKGSLKINVEKDQIQNHVFLRKMVSE